MSVDDQHNDQTIPKNDVEPEKTSQSKEKARIQRESRYQNNSRDYPNGNN